MARWLLAGEERWQSREKGEGEGNEKAALDKNGNSLACTEAEDGSEGKKENMVLRARDGIPASGLYQESVQEVGGCFFLV